MLIETGDVRELGLATQPWLRFGDLETDQPKPPSGPRLLLVEGEPAFELSFWCGSCAFLFQRLSGANQKASIPALAEQLSTGLDSIDDAVIYQFSQILPKIRTCRCCCRSNLDSCSRTRPTTTSLMNS